MRTAARAKARSGRVRWAARIVGAGLTATAALGIAAGPALAQAGPPSDQGVQPVLSPDMNPPVSCPTGATGFRVEEPAVGTTNVPIPGDDAKTFELTVTNTDQGQVFSFHIPDDAQRAAVQVTAKGGNVGANVYTYDSMRFPNGEVIDGSLHAPINPSNKFADLSHIDFCLIPCP
ncbi:hypothetical protein AQI88_09105 [Streptomyces cellostaticus]|uniref:Uncharacterized protein n=1 Tax=Streptomyces cellostaticus TaxID=67285 RepID=A0A117PXK7_9ACTN|nr:hypothetical protein [Streptomyces cellostaticus]KUM97147.1 hypothetical protein AQI88_09105 [Streptomyces cellostaticus]GHI03772.1 hypothetical protein Scel_20930 [Streptomyces cellostaticus]